MRNALASAAPQLMAQAMTNQLSNARLSRTANVSDDRSAVVEMPAELSGSGSNDLFVYRLGTMTLKEGERCTMPILSTKAPYRDVYTWDIEWKHDQSTAGPLNSDSPLEISEQKIYRQIELINQSNLPWTTGAAMFVDGYQPIAQDLLTYTSPGGLARVPVTVAVDLKGQIVDSEVERKMNAQVWRGSSYARVEGRVAVTLVNRKSKPVAVEIRLRFGGKAIEATENGTISYSTFRRQDWANYRGEPAVNQSSTVTWRSTVNAEQSLAPEVRYEFFLAH